MIDVAILYQIITSAQQSSSLKQFPFRAIFAAYEEVLARNRLDPNHDQIYLRFLLRLGDRKQSNKSLYESFEALLAELGIQIEINAGEDDGPHITRNFSTEGDINADTTTQSNANGRARGNARRASFHSLYGTENESFKAEKTRPPSRASSFQYPSGRRVAHSELPATRASIRSTERSTHQPSHSTSALAHHGRGRLTAQEFASNLQHYQRRNESAQGVSNNRFNNHVLFGNSSVEQSPKQPSTCSSERRYSSNPSDYGEFRNGLSDNLQKNQLSYALSQHELLYRPSDTQLLRDADTFEHYRVNGLARKIIRKWLLVALPAEKRHKEMEICALNYDTEALIRQGFNHWRMRLYRKRRAAEIEGFFCRLGIRAGKARDLYLLTKAFTHWVECAYEVGLRTYEARRRVLSSKYFNVWRDVTVANELKVRRLGLHKFFNIWKQRCVRNLTDEATAITFGLENLLQTAYWRWFWTFCEERAPEWRDARMRKTYAILWVLKIRQISQRESNAVSVLHDKKKRNVFGQWLYKTRAIVTNSQEAVRFNQQNLKNSLLNEWKLKRQHAPLAQRISNMVDWRVAGATFATFVARFRIERRAEEVNRLRIMRNSWTQWNNRLRWQTLARQIDDRFVLEALYKWVIAERLALLQRLNAQRLKQKILLLIDSRYAAIQAQRALSFQVVEQNRKIRHLRLLMMRWKQRLESYRQVERKALEFYSLRISQEALQIWSAKSIQLQKLSRWANDANYYFLVTKRLEHWRAAVVESKREKRRDAYIRVRRRSKMDLARGVIWRWRDLVSQLVAADQEAQGVNQERLLQVGTNLFYKWETRWKHAMNQNLDATDYYQRKITIYHFRTWLDRLQAYTEHEKVAQQFSYQRLEKPAFRLLHRLRLQVLELQGRTRTADSLHALHTRRHVHNFLRHWHSLTASARNLSPSRRDTPFSARVKRLTSRTEPEDLTARAEDWTAFEDGFDLGDWKPALDAHSSATPLPARFMPLPSTPAVRVRFSTKAGTSTTPAWSPRPEAALLSNTPATGGQPGTVTPMFQRRQRLHFDSQQRRGPLGRSVGFAPVVEDEPKTPGR